MNRLEYTAIASVLICGLLAGGGVVTQQAAAQDRLEQEHENLLIQAGLIWGMPQGALSDNLPREPFGANFLIGGQVPGLPLYLASEISFLNFGMQEQLNLYSLEDVPVQAVTSAASHHIFMGHLIARFQVEAGPANPHIDLLGGLKSFASRSSVESDVPVFPSGFQASARIFDYALSYGFGAGVNLPLYEGPFGADRRRGLASLNLSVRYLFGTDADIATASRFDEDEGVFRFDVVRSSTTMLIPQIGVRVDL